MLDTLLGLTMGDLSATVIVQDWVRGHTDLAHDIRHTHYWWNWCPLIEQNLVDSGVVTCSLGLREGCGGRGIDNTD